MYIVLQNTLLYIILQMRALCSQSNGIIFECHALTELPEAEKANVASERNYVNVLLTFCRP